METETVHYNEENDELENMFRDSCKRNWKNGQIYVVFGIEFHSWIDYSIPLRVMGYDYTAYENQMKRFLEKKKQELRT